VKIAARLLAAFGSLDDAYRALDDGRADDVAEIIGEPLATELASPASRELVALNRCLMTMNEALRLPAVKAMRLPLDPDRVAAALTARQIRLGPSLWALLGRPAPAWLGYGGYDRAPNGLPRVDEPILFASVARPSLPPPAPVDPAHPPTRITPRRRGLPARVPEGQLALFDA
jgi:DNA polymerase-1